MTQTDQKRGNAPTFIAYHEPTSHFEHKDGEGFNLRIEMSPFDVFAAGELNIQLRCLDPKDAADGEPITGEEMAQA
jgi:hypothetical protein